MRRVWLIVRRELLEQARQPVMLAVIGATFVFFGLAVLPPLWIMEQVSAFPELQAGFLEVYGGAEDPSLFLQTLAHSAVQVENYLLFAQLITVSSVLAGQATLHDRQCHTLSFLLLAPLRRVELLVGKVLGAMCAPTLLYWLVGALSLGLASRSSLLVDYPALPSAPAWWVFFLFSAPLWAFSVSAICVAIGHRSSDVRTAQQGVVFVVLPSVIVGQVVLIERLGAGPWMQVALAGGCALLSALIVAGAARLMR